MRHPSSPALAALLVAAGLALSACRGGGPAQPADQAAPDGPTPVWWHPSPDISWAWQLDGDIVVEPGVRVYDVDLFDAPDAALSDMADRGLRLICYFSAGTIEDWRPDVADVPRAVIGRPLEDWPGERWLDVRSAAVRALVGRRLDLAAERGCDGVEPDNVQGHVENTGFPLTRDDLVDYVRFVAAAAHDRGLAVGLKNGPDLVSDVLDAVDFAVVEECAMFDECDAYDAFVAAGKPVLHAEYDESWLDVENLDVLCADTSARGFATIVVPVALDGSYRLGCV